MQNFTRINPELFRRTPDETYPSLQALVDHCRQQREASQDRWLSPSSLWAKPISTNRLALASGEDQVFQLTDWSFGQLCRLAGVAKETVNRLTADTAARVLAETLRRGSKPLQVLAAGDVARSIHGASYTRLYDVELLDAVADCAAGLEPPPDDSSGGASLYCGEQDMFCFLIDPNGWMEIGSQAFAPGLFLWNSEVGRRLPGIETFWFQAASQGHIVWEAGEIVDFSRRRIAQGREAVPEIRQVLRELAAKWDQRRDAFARVIQRAMETQLGEDADAVQAVLAKAGVGRTWAKEAIELSAAQGPFTVFAVVEALSKLARRMRNAGERTEVDRQAGKLLALAA